GERAAEAVAGGDDLAVGRGGGHLGVDQVAVGVELVHADAGRIEIGDHRLDLARPGAAERDDRRLAGLGRQEGTHHELVGAADDRQRLVAVDLQEVLVPGVEILVDHAVGELLDDGVGVGQRLVLGLGGFGLGGVGLGGVGLGGVGLGDRGLAGELGEA